MAEPLRHRQTKEAATDMFGLQPPRHISTLPIASGGSHGRPTLSVRSTPNSDRKLRGLASVAKCQQRTQR